MGVPYTRSTFSVTRDWIDKKELSEGKIEPKKNTRYFLSSLSPEERRAPASIRGHWAVENKNHYKRDTCQWREDHHRHRTVHAAQNLALLRNALLAIIPFDEKTTLSQKLDEYQAHPARALKLIMHGKPI